MAEFLLRYTWLLVLIRPTDAQLGLTSPRRLHPYLVRSPGHRLRIPELMPPDLICCDILKLKKEQRRLCLDEPEIAPVLLKAALNSIDMCRFQFQHERWNCDFERGRRPRLLQQGVRETGYLYAITSASLVFSFARACSENRLPQCSCDDTDDVTSLGMGHCSDNLRAGVRLAQRFLRTGDWDTDIKGQLNNYNSNLGLQIPGLAQRQICHCHGTSGSCTFQTCYNHLPQFHNISDAVKVMYDSARQETTNRAGGLVLEFPTFPVDQPSTATSPDVAQQSYPVIIYTDPSPDFCERSSYSRGTTKRECLNAEHCERLCCGRGYHHVLEETLVDCRCTVQWCCRVTCETCPRVVDKLRCKGNSHQQQNSNIPLIE